MKKLVLPEDFEPIEYKIEDIQDAAERVKVNFGDDFWEALKNYELEVKRKAEQKNDEMAVYEDIIKDENYMIDGITGCDGKTVTVSLFERTPKTTKIRARYNGVLSYYNVKDFDIIKDYVRMSTFTGEYILTVGLTEDDMDIFFNNYGNGDFPYNIPREYEAEHHLNKFKKTAKVDKNIRYNFSKYLKYTFGLEFETSCGYISEEDCFHNGLIPLRDGSIGGIEYSTIVLEGNKGINLLRQAVEVLKDNTFFDKECSLHIHLGGLPVTPINIFTFYKVWETLQYNLLEYIPRYSYNTREYKSNGKDYCKEIPEMRDFNSLFNYYVGDNYMGSLVQPHPADVEKVAKWHIDGRYYNCNFINMLCYNKAKTIEFRFLRPTYNFKKICTWILILNAALAYSEKLIEDNKITSCAVASRVVERGLGRVPYKQGIIDVLSSIYPENLVKDIEHTLKVMANIVSTQARCRDYCGARVDIEEKMFENDSKKREQKDKKC